MSFVSPRPSLFPEGKPKETLSVSGKQNSVTKLSVSVGVSHQGYSSEIKFTDEFFRNFLWMFSTKNVFVKWNKNDRSPFSFKRSDKPVLLLITRVIHRVQVTFCGSSKQSFIKVILGKKTWKVESDEHNTIILKFVDTSHYLKRGGHKAFEETLFSG